MRQQENQTIATRNYENEEFVREELIVCLTSLDSKMANGSKR